LIAVIILAVPTISSHVFGIFDLSDAELSDLVGETNQIYILLASSIIALIGVLVTGFIFLSENLRGIVGSNPAYEYISEATREYVVKRLVIISIVSIVASMIFVMMIVLPYSSEDEAGWIKTVAGIISLDMGIGFKTSIFFLRWFLSAVFLMIFEASLYYSFKMIKMVDTMDWYADIKIAEHDREMSRPIIVTLDGEEYNKMAASDVIRDDPATGVERIAKPGKDGREFVSFKTVKGTGIHIYDAGKVFFVSEIRRDEILSEMIEGHYKVRELDCDFDIKQTVNVFNTIEKILAKVISSDVILYKHRDALQSSFSPLVRSWDVSSISDDIATRFFNARDFRDMFQIRRAKYLNFKLADRGNKVRLDRFQKEQLRYLVTLSRNVSVLLFEISGHMYEKNLNDMDLSNFEASTHQHPFDFRQTKLIDCNLKGMMLTEADLRDADLTHSDLTEADLRGAKLSGAVMTDALFSKILSEGSRMDNVAAEGITMTDNHFDAIPINSCFFARAVMRQNTFVDCSLCGSNFTQAMMLNVSFKGSVLTGSRMSEAIINHSEFENCALVEMIMNSAFISHSMLVSSDFSKSTIQDVKMVSVLSIDADFSKCQMDRALIDRCHFFAPSLDDAIFKESRFETTTFSEYLLEVEEVGSGDSHVPNEGYRVLKDCKGLEYLHYRVESSGKTKAEETPDMRVGATGNPIPVMRRAMFDSSYLTGVGFFYVFMPGASLRRCIIKDTKFSFCNLSSSNFLNSDIVNTAFVNCNLFQAEFRDSFFDFCLFQNVENLNISRMEGAKARRSYVMDCSIVRGHITYIMKGKSIQLDELLENNTDDKWESFRTSNGLESVDEIASAKAKAEE